MRLMDEEDLLDNLTEDIIAYVMQGKIQEDILADKIRYADLDDRFSDFERLMDLHFVLQDEVVEFVESLQQDIRQIKTQTKNIKRQRRGRVDGRIDWSSTLQRRYSTNPKDTSLFVCENRSENYDIDENIVLKRLISLIHKTLEDVQNWIKNDHDWINKQWRENSDLIQRLSNIVERNVHIKRIKDPEEYEPTDRMLETAHRSRKKIYRDAAALLEQRRSIQEGEEEELRRMLKRTVIRPEDEDTLFELFVLFRFIAVLIDMGETDFEIKTIRREKQEVARLRNQNGREIRVYHDSSGGKALSFIYDKKGRPKQVEEEARKVIKTVLGKETEKHTKRPDVLLIEVEGRENTEYLITEVKNSSRTDTIKRGIREGLEYLAYLQENNEFRFTAEDFDHGIFGNEYNGLLVVQDTDKIDTPIEEQEHPLKILTASDLLQEEGAETPLEFVFQELLEEF